MDLYISDIFDGLQENTVDLTCREAASAERVKALTLEKLHHMQPKAHRHFRLPMAAAAAILTALLATTAIAANSFGVADWFRSIFGTMTPEQQEAAQSLTMDQPQPVSVSENGTTVTLLGAIGDTRSCYARLRFEAPAGTILEIPTGKSELALMKPPKAPDYLEYRTLACPELVSSRSFSYYENLIWEDPIPGDNALELIMQIGLPQDSLVSFQDEHPDFLNMDGLYLRTDTPTGWESEPILEGPWTIPLAPMGGTTKDLEAQGTVCVLKLNDGQSYTLTLNRLAVSPLGIELEARYDRPMDGSAGYVYPTACAYTLDGQAIPGTISYDRFSRLDNQVVSYSYLFDAPVALEDMDSLVFCGQVFPISGDGSAAPEAGPEEMILGTHVTLGKPGSLRSGEPPIDPETIDGSMGYDQFLAAASWADYTPEGIRLMRPAGDRGRLIYTLTDARVIRDLKDLDGDLSGFDRETYYGEDGMGNRPRGILPDGSFQEGWQLIALDVTLYNDGVHQTMDDLGPSATVPDSFNTTGLFFLANLREKSSANFPYITSNYFTDNTDHTGWVNYVPLAPGQTKEVTVGFLAGPDFADRSLGNLRATNTSGWERGVFIDLNLQ